MGIGIMTLFNNLNYGATLQAFALQTVISDMGYECEDIDYVREVHDPQISNLSKTDMIRKKLEQLLHYPSYKKEKKGTEIRRRAFQRFIEERMNVSEKRYVGHKEIKDAADQYDIFVCGSDNIWNKNLLDTAFFLDFVPDHAKRIAYAPGMSTNTLTKEQAEIIKPLVMKFDALSVREKTGRDLIAKLTGRKVLQAMDPTLLIPGERWRKVSKSLDLPVRHYVFCYFFGTNPFGRQCAIDYARKHQLPLVTLPMHGRYEAVDFRFGDYRLYDVEPGQFIWLIDHATAVFTDSFHGTIFSILLEKPFYCFRRFFEETTRSLNFRIDSLLETLKIEGRIIEEKTAFQKDGTIDYVSVGKIIQEKRSESISYLADALRRG